MANEVHRKKLVANTDFDFDATFDEIDSVATGDLVWSAPVTDCGTCDEVHAYVRIAVGTTPTIGGTIEFYAGYGDDDATSEIRSGCDNITTTDHGEATDTDFVTQALATLDFLGAISVDDETATQYSKRLVIPRPGDDFNLYIYNNTGAAFAASGHVAHYIGWGDEIQ